MFHFGYIYCLCSISFCLLFCVLATIWYCAFQLSCTAGASPALSIQACDAQHLVNTKDVPSTLLAIYTVR